MQKIEFSEPNEPRYEQKTASIADSVSLTYNIGSSFLRQEFLSEEIQINNNWKIYYYEVGRKRKMYK